MPILPRFKYLSPSSYPSAPDRSIHNDLSKYFKANLNLFVCLWQVAIINNMYGIWTSLTAIRFFIKPHRNASTSRKFECSFWLSCLTSPEESTMIASSESQKLSMRNDEFTPISDFQGALKLFFARWTGRIEHLTRQVTFSFKNNLTPPLLPSFSPTSFG